MTLRWTCLLTGLALSLGACGGGGGGSGGNPSVPVVPTTPQASRTQIVVDATTPHDLETLCVDKGAELLVECEGTDYSVVGVPDGTSVEKFIKDCEEESCVEDLDEDEGAGCPEAFPEGGGSTIPLFGDDPVASVGTQPSLARIGVPLARGRGFDGTGVLVAVIDTGVNATHPLLAGRVAPGGWDFLDNDADPSDVGNGRDDNLNGRVDEGVGHGTFVASLVLAVAPNARILPLRALDSDAVGTSSTVARAVVYAVDMGADVINFSAGLMRDLRLIQQAIAYAKEQGVVVIAAAGNRQSAVEFPAFLSEVEAVTSVDATDRKSTFASFGSSVDLCAPGDDLIGAHPLSPSGTARWSGTSFSTAIVTGSFALIRGNDQKKSTGEGILRWLEERSTSINSLNPMYSGKLGRGRIDLNRATSGGD